MKRKDDQKILKEYITQVLKEDEGYATDAFGAGDYSTGDYGTGGLGWGPYGSPGVLYKTFVQPFVDVIGVAAGKTKELARRAITVVQVAFENLMTTLIPFLTDSYDEIFASEARDLQKIQNEYGKYYQATSDAIGGGATALALIAFPGAALAGKFAQEAPDAAKNILSIATGGLSDKYLSGGGGKSSGKGPKDMFDSYTRSYAMLISEDDEKKKKLATKIGSRKFVNALINRSPMMAAASRDALEIYKKTLNSAYEQAKMVLSANTIDDIEKAIGEKIEAASELKKLSGAEKSKAEKELLKTVKKSAKEIYIARLELEIKPVINAFGEEHPFVQGYKEVIDKIRAL